MVAIDQAEKARGARRRMYGLPGRAVVAALSLTVVALGSVQVSADAVAVRGVAPADQALFAPSGVKCTVAGVAQTVALSRVNDDYCDCEDGKDEPGTTACSHLMHSLFYCDNGGFFPKHIHTSLVNDGICDCCDGSDEFDKAAGAAACANTCAADSVTHRKQAEERLVDIEAGFKKREQALKNVVAVHFNDANEKDALTEKMLASLALLKERVELHKAREERREKKIRLETARQRHAHDNEDHAQDEDCVPDAESGKTCVNPDEKLDGVAEAFDEVDALRVTRDEAVAGFVETEVGDAVYRKDATAADESDSHRVTTMIEISDGTSVSLADYLHLEQHTRSPKKLKGPARTADQKRREDFLGPLFNGNDEDRKRMGLYALRTVGIVASPLRLAAEAVLFLPRQLWNVLSSSVLVSPYLDKLPSLPSVVQSPTFRRLGNGQVYRWYKNVVWGGRVVWDAPVVAYSYLFPVLDLDLKLPEAESLRKVLKEIEDDMDKLRKDRDAQQADLAIDFGPDRAFYVLKDQCIEKKVEKYVYKLCAFQDVKQDYTTLGKWEGFGQRESDESAAADKPIVNYNVLNFTQGQRCWNGPERSVKVTLECGASNEILSVDEPSTCIYEMHARSYVACTPEVLSKAKQDLAFWSK